MKFKISLLIGAVIVIAAFAAFRVAVIRQRPEDVTNENVATAIQKWTDAAPDNYTIRVHVKGPMTGVYELHVQNKIPVSGSFNGEEFTNERAFAIWTGRGLLRMLEMDLLNQKKAEERGSRLLIRADYDKEFGFPRRYHRLDFETRKSVTWEVTDFVVK